jgi:hypothetical protein
VLHSPQVRDDGTATHRGNRFGLIVRGALLLAGLPTYLISPDDAVWRFIRTAPHARALEHVLFGIAVAILGLALLLKVKASAHPENRDSHGLSGITAATVRILQAIGIGSLMPLARFLLLVLGDVVVSLLLYGRHSTPEDPRSEREDYRQVRVPLQAFRWRDALATHLGLCCAFLSMAIFSVVLIDRVANVLFAMAALVSVAGNCRRFPRGCSWPPLCATRG